MRIFLIWLRGLLAASISAFATGAAGALALPTVFTVNRVGFINMVKLGTPAALLAVLFYLKQSPLPSLTVTDETKKETAAGTETNTVTVTKN